MVLVSSFCSLFRSHLLTKHDSDIDWEYPAGNGADYRQILNSEKASEIETFPLFLQAVKDAIGDKSLSIASPALKHDMIAYTEEQSPAIWAAVDYINVRQLLLSW